MKRETVFSGDRIFRYTLWRDWSDERCHKCEDIDMFPAGGIPCTCPDKPEQFVQFIGLNPSTADEITNDPTIRRLINFAKAWGYGAMCMTNAFAFRSRDPYLMKMRPDRIGADNDRWLRDVARAAALTVCCWGRHAEFKDRGNDVAKMLRADGIKLHYFRMLEGGTPEHPLYLPKTLEPSLWT